MGASGYVAQRRRLSDALWEAIRLIGVSAGYNRAGLSQTSVAATAVNFVTVDRETPDMSAGGTAWTGLRRRARLVVSRLAPRVAYR